jgi:hypothetical protein
MVSHSSPSTSHRPHELLRLQRHGELQNAPELGAAVALSSFAPDRAPRGVVQAPAAAVEPAEPGQLAEAELSEVASMGPRQEHLPNVAFEP